MISRKFAAAGAVSILVVAGAVAASVELSSRSAIPSGKKPGNLHASKKPSVKVATSKRTRNNSGSSGDPSYFSPPVVGAGTGNPALPIGNYQEYWPTTPANYETTAYFLNITQSRPGGSFSGTMYLRYEDGKVDTVFPFSGEIGPGGSTATFTVTGPPTVVVYDGKVAYTQAVAKPGYRLGANLSARTVTMVGCENYLHFLTASGGAPPIQLSSDPNLCNFYYIGGEPFPARSQIPITPESQS